MNKIRRATLGLFAAIIFAGGIGGASAAQFFHSGEIEILFPPRDDFIAALEKEFAKAKHEVLVMAFSFTHKKITAELIKLHRRGVRVSVLADRRQMGGRGNRIKQLRDAGIYTAIPTGGGLWHNKVMVIDGRTVITGSANFTRAAENRNRENVVIIRDNISIAGHYRKQWQLLVKEAVPLGRDE